MNLPTPRFSSLAWVRTEAGSLLFAAAAAAVFGAFVHHHGYAVLGALVATLVLGFAWPWLCVLPLRAELRFDRERGREGVPSRARMVIRNRCPWPAWAVGVRSQSGSLGEPPVLRIGPWGTCEVSWDFISRARGECPRGAVHLTCGFPFGLCEASKRVAVRRPLLAWPGAVPVGALSDVAVATDDAATAWQDRPGYGGDALGLRPYRRGDALQLVHWGQTARHDRLIVRETQASYRPRVRIVLDADPAAVDRHARSPDVVTDGEGDGRAAREGAIRLTGSLMEAWVARGAEVVVVIDGRSFTASHSPRDYCRAMDALARLPNVAAAGGRDAVRIADAADRSGHTILVTAHRRRDVASAGGGYRRGCAVTVVTPRDEGDEHGGTGSAVSLAVGR